MEGKKEKEEESCEKWQRQNCRRKLKDNVGKERQCGGNEGNEEQGQNRKTTNL